MVDSSASWSFTITHYDKSNSWATQDLSDDAFPRMFTDTGDGKVNAATVRIEATGGKYITSGTKIDLNDRIRIVGDDGGSGTYNRVFDVIKLIPIKSKSEGVMLELQCLGIERWLQQVQYSRRHWSKTPKQILADMIDQYNYNAAQSSELPTINTSGGEISVNELPSTMKFPNDFGTNESSIFDRMNELVDGMSAPQASGGILDFFDIRFVSSVSNVTSFDIEIFSSGNTTRSKPSETIDGSTADSNLEEGTDGGLDEAEGTIINNWGANGAGSLPTNYSKFQSSNLEMPTNLGTQSLFSEYDAAFDYTTGAIIKYTTGTPDKCYIAASASGPSTSVQTPPTSGDTAYWNELTTEDYYGSIQYSPWTDGVKVAWDNCGGDPQNTKTYGYGNGMFDANIVINGDEEFRTWVDVIAYNSGDIASEWKYSGTTLYDGFRVLVKGTGNGDFASFDNQVIEYDGIEEIWKTKYALVADFMVVVFEEGNVWRYDGGGSYTDMSTKHNGLDCFHPGYVNQIYTSTSAIQNRTSGTAVDFSANADSGIMAEYRYVPLQTWNDEYATIIKILQNPLGWVWQQVTGGNGSTKSTDDWYSAGAWLSMRFPFPRSSFVSGPAVGSLYGGTSGGNIVPYLDAQNMSFSRGGLFGYNNGVLSEDLGQLSAVEFKLKLAFASNKVLDGLDQILHKANFKMAMYFGDKNDNVVKQEFTVGFNNMWDDFTLPLSGFTQYRGRLPIYEENFVTTTIIPPKELSHVSQFRWHEVSWMVIQCEESYNNEGRYRAASGNELGVGDWLFDSVLHNYMKFQIHLDALRFAKPLLVNSGQSTTQHKQPDFIQSPEIESYNQLKNNCLAELEKAQFQKKQYDIISEGDFTIEYGDYFLFDDDDIVYMASPNANEDTNKVELVAKHIEYTYSKGDGMPGGYKRRIIGAKRFT